MKKHFIVGLLAMSPLCLWADPYEAYPASCQEAFNQIDDLIKDPTGLKEKYNLSASVVEQVKSSAIEEINANPDDEDIICGMIAPALDALIEFKKPKDKLPEPEKAAEQNPIEPILEK